MKVTAETNESILQVTLKPEKPEELIVLGYLETAIRVLRGIPMLTKFVENNLFLTFFLTSPKK